MYLQAKWEKDLWKTFLDGGGTRTDTSAETIVAYDTKNGSVFKQYEDKKCETEEKRSVPFPPCAYNCDFSGGANLHLHKETRG